MPRRMQEVKAERFEPNTVLWAFHTMQPSSSSCNRLARKSQFSFAVSIIYETVGEAVIQPTGRRDRPIPTAQRSFRTDHSSLRLLSWVEILGEVDARVDAKYAFPCADVSVDWIAECGFAVDSVRLPDLFQFVRHRDRLSNSRLYNDRKY